MEEEIWGNIDEVEKQKCKLFGCEGLGRMDFIWYTLQSILVWENY